MANIVLTGATGYIGKALCSALIHAGHSLTVLTRGKSTTKNNINYLHYSGKSLPEKVLAIDDCDAIIHLAGLSVNTGFRWSSKVKRELFESRVEPLNALFNYCKSNHLRPKLISASGVSHYTDNYTGHYNELSDTSQSTNFLAQVCHQWEAAAHQFQSIGSIVSIVRTAVVLEQNNEVIQRLKKVIRIPMMALPYSGKNAFPWIALNDLVRVYALLLENENSIVCNAVSPANDTLADVLEQIKGSKKLILPLPPFILKLIFGEKSVLYLQGAFLESLALKELGFRYDVQKISEL